MSNLAGPLPEAFTREKRKEELELANLPLLNRLLHDASV